MRMFMQPRFTDSMSFFAFPAVMDPTFKHLLGGELALALPWSVHQLAELMVSFLFF